VVCRRGSDKELKALKGNRREEGEDGDLFSI